MDETQTNREAAYQEYLEKYPILKEIDSLAAKREELLEKKKTPKIIKVFSAVVIALAALFFSLGFYLAMLQRKAGEDIFTSFIKAAYSAGVIVIVADAFILLLLLLVVFLRISGIIRTANINKQLSAIEKTLEEIKNIPPFEG